MFFRFFSRPADTVIRVRGTNLLLRPPKRQDIHQWIRLRAESQDFLRPWEPRWPEDDLSAKGYLHRWRSYSSQWQAGTAKTFFLFENNGKTLLGGVSLTRIDRESKNSAMLGYWMGKPYAGRGIMTKAVPAILDFAFDTLELAYVEAACLPHNLRSINLLARSGFTQTGFIPKFLEINGLEEDHIILRYHSLNRFDQTGKTIENTGKSAAPVV